MNNPTDHDNQGASSEKSGTNLPKVHIDTLIEQAKSYGVGLSKERIEQFLSTYGEGLDVTVMALWPAHILGCPTKKSGKNVGEARTTKCWLLKADKSNWKDALWHSKWGVAAFNRMGYNIYITAAHHDAYYQQKDGDKREPEPKKPEERDVIAANYAFLDIDKAVDVGQFIVSDLQPTFIVASGGGGINCHWRYDEPQQVRNFVNEETEKAASELYARVYGVNYALSKAHGGDHTYDLGRIMRCPWFYNFPSAVKLNKNPDRKVAMATLMWGPPGSGAEQVGPGYRRFALGELPYDKEAAASTGARRRRGGKGKQDWPAAERPPSAEPLDDLDAFPIVSRHGVPNGLNIKQIILYGFDPEQPLRYTKDDGSIDRSDWVIYVMTSLIRGGYPHERAKWLMTNPGQHARLRAFREEGLTPAAGFEGDLQPGHTAGDAVDWLAEIPEAHWEGEFERQWEHAVGEVEDDPVWAAHKLDGAVAAPHQAPQARKVDGRTVISGGTPRETAQLFKKEVHPTLLFQNENWMAHTGTHYEIMEKGQIKRDVATFQSNCLVKDKEGTLKPCSPHPEMLNGTVTMLEALDGVYKSVAELKAPCWIEGEDSLPDPKAVLVCKNKLFDLNSDRTLEHTPNFFSFNSLGFDYVPSADLEQDMPRRWMQFLNEVWPDAYAELEEKKLHWQSHSGIVGAISNEITLLQEWFGYMLTPDTSQQKILNALGPEGSGKGTVIRVLGLLLGEENYCAPSIAQVNLNEGFGLANAIDKLAMFITDARLGPKDNKMAITDALKQISGEDPVEINRKRIAFWRGKLNTRIVIASEDMLDLPDTGGWFRRIIPLQFGRSFQGNPDPLLMEKLKAELPGILRWAIVGWKRLNQRGRFIIPEKSKQGIEAVKQYVNPELRFLEDDCLIGGEAAQVVLDKELVYGAYVLWCKANNEYTKSKNKFYMALHKLTQGQIANCRPVVGGNRVESVRGLQIVRNRALADKDGRVLINDPVSTYVFSGADAVAGDLMGALGRLRDGDQMKEVMDALWRRITKATKLEVVA